MNRKPKDLQSLCFDRISRDILRHVAKWKTEADEQSSVYSLFRRMHCEEVTFTWPPSEEVESPPEMFSSEFFDFINFLFNQHVKKIVLFADLTTPLARAIINNCKNLIDISIWNYRPLQNLHNLPDFLKSLKNLVVLNLQRCSFPVAPTMKAIVDNLVNLKVLNVSQSDVDDAGLLLLCGHKEQCAYSLSVCALSRNCRANSKLKLCSLAFKLCAVSRVVFACVVTHLPTLKVVQGTAFIKGKRVLLSDVITYINQQRGVLNAPILQFQLEDIHYITNSKVLRACLQACPKLKILRLNFENESIACRILKEDELNCLERVYITGTNVCKLFAEDFKILWIKRGHLLKELWISSYTMTDQIVADLDVICNVLALCPRLEFLTLRRVVFPQLLVKRYSLEGFPELQNLKQIYITVDGEACSLNMFAYKLLISSATNNFIDFRVRINEHLTKDVGVQEALSALKAQFC